MYQPRSPRPKKTNITRSRAGCVPCRRKRRKCDEVKPACQRCSRTSGSCYYPQPRVDFQVVNVQTSDKTWAASSRSDFTSSRGSGEMSGAGENPSSGTHWSSSSSMPSTPQTPQQFYSTREHQQPSGTDMLESPPESRADAITSPQVSANQHLCGQLVDVRPGSRHDHSPASGTEVHAEMPLLHFDLELSTGQMPLHVDSQNSPAGGHVELAPNGLAWMESNLAIWPTPTDLSTSSTNNTDDLDFASRILPSIGTINTWAPDDLGMFALGKSRSWSNWAPPNNELWHQAPYGQSRLMSSSLDSSGLVPSMRHASMSNKPMTLEDRNYLSHFMLEVQHNIPWPFDELWPWVSDYGLVKMGALVLSAANLANRQGTLVPGSRGRWVPKAKHAAAAAQYMLRCEDADLSLQSMPICPRLAFRILLICHELEKGSILGMREQLALFDEEISESSDKLLSSSAGQSILRNHVLLRYLEINSRKPFAALGKESRTETFVASLQPYLSAPSFTVRTVGHMACRISWRICMLYCIRGFDETPATTMEKMSEWWDLVMGGPCSDNKLGNDSIGTPTMDEAELFTELRSLSVTLHNLPSPKGLARWQYAESPKSLQSTPNNSSVQQVSLQDFGDAMHCAEYAFAQLMCDGVFLSHLTAEDSTYTRDTSATSFDLTPMSDSPWLKLLLNITDRLSPIHCQRHNTYKIGVINMLLYCFFLGAGRPALDCLDNFLRRAASASVQYEGPFSPIESSWVLSRAIRREIESQPERAIFIAITLMDPDVTEPLYSRYVGEALLICGREANGLYFRDIVPLQSGITQEGTEDCLRG
ncbi:hypothetical protein CC79DRAFT_464916 [Sarocladium strictum]